MPISDAMRIYLWAKLLFDFETRRCFVHGLNVDDRQIIIHKYKEKKIY